MKLLYRFLMRKRIAAVKKAAAMIAQYPMREERERYQIEKFNAVWRTARENVPFYRAWQAKYGLPDAIADLSELRDWPVLKKADLLDETQFRRSDVPYPRGRLMTGGSTGVPVRLPAWGRREAWPSQVLGRMRYGYEVGDRLFLLWGHEHLFGKGVRRFFKIWERRIKDRLAGWMRVSAYDLSVEALKGAFERFVHYKPQFVMGYSPSILSFCRINKNDPRRITGVKAVLCSAGPLSMDERHEVSAFFGAPVCMEYGSVECGIMAYTQPEDGKYHAFWNTHLLQALKDDSGNFRNIVTCLTDCYVPLIHYDIGDYLEIDGSEEENMRSVLTIADVKGRPSEFLKFKCGVSVFAWGVGDCVKQSLKVGNHQLVVNEDRNELTIRVTSSEKMLAEDFEIIRNRLQLTVKGVDRLTLRFEQVDKLDVTVAGKTPRVIRGK